MPKVILVGSAHTDLTVKAERLPRSGETVVGTSYDVLIQSQKVSPILHPAMRSLYLAVSILVVIIWIWRNTKAKTLRVSLDSP